jgi:sarcosine oxidase, subunit beta
MSSDTAVDVVVIGAGAIGASSAFRLAEAGLRVAVIEALDGPAAGSTGRSFASIRGQWADDLNIELSWRSIQAFRDFPETYGVDVGYRPSGYLLLVSDPLWSAQLDAVVRQRAHGVPVDVLSFDAAQQITPFEVSGLGGVTWGSADGVVDPHLVTSAWIELARDRGAAVSYRRPVTAIEQNADGGWTVRAGDRAVTAQFLVNAAGGWAGEVAALAGFEVPVVHSRRNVFSTAPGAVPAPLPMTVDFSSGVYLRSEGPRLLFGGARPDEVDRYNVDVDWPWLEALLELGIRRFPWLADVPLDRSGCWAGTYENTPDHHGILGPAPGAPSWINACGFSGHGLMQAPEIGRLVAEQVTTGAISSIDAGALRMERFADESARNRVELVF